MLSGGENGPVSQSFNERVLPLAQAQAFGQGKKRVALREAIGKRYHFHGGTAGSPLIAADLRGEDGWSHVSRTRVAREMKALGLRCRVRPARKVFTTQSRHGQLVLK